MRDSTKKQQQTAKDNGVYSKYSDVPDRNNTNYVSKDNLNKHGEKGRHTRDSNEKVTANNRTAAHSSKQSN